MTNPVSVPRELLPCPFCGGKALRSSETLDERYGYAKRVTYRCTGCGCERGAVGDTSRPGYADNSTVEQRARNAWNRRAAPAAAPSQDDVRDAERANAAFNAVIAYMLGDGRWEEPMEFLRCWNEGNFDALRKEWPEAPLEIYYADPLADRSAIDAAIAHQHEQEKGDE